MRYWFWPGIESGSKDIPRGNKMCMSSVFRNILAICKQTFSESIFGFVSGETQANILYICYQQRTSVIMYLRLHKIILSKLSASSENDLPRGKSHLLHFTLFYSV